MAPKKKDECTVKKTPKKRVIKAKEEGPKKTPSVITIKPAKTCVALAQFKQPDLTKDPLQLSLLVSEPEYKPAPAARGKRKPPAPVKETNVKCKRKKKDTVTNDAPLDSEFEKEAPSKIVTKKPVAKKTAASKSPKVTKLPDSKNDEEKVETSKPPTRKLRGRPKMITSKTNDVSIEKVDTSKVEEIEIKEEIPLVINTTSKPSKPKNQIPNGTTKHNLKRKMVPKRFLSKEVNIPSKSDTKITNPGKPVSVSRKTSQNSNGSSLSWTHDISMSTSTTTCITVTSNDFVRIDKKLPVLQVVPVVTPPSDRSPPSSSSSSVSSSSDSEVEDGNRQLNLSVSTSVASESRQESLDVNAVSALIEEFASSFLEFETYLDSRCDRSVQAPPKAFSDVIKRESVVIMLCESLRRNLSASEGLFARPAPPRPRNERPVPQEKPPAPKMLPPAPKMPPPAPEMPPPSPEMPPPSLERSHEPADEVTPVRVCIVPFENEDDVDDTLSIYAGSISGIESSRVSNSVQEKSVEEYIPTPVAPQHASRCYRPTRIEPRRPTISEKLSICEKHSADSTSVRDAGTRMQHNPETQQTEIKQRQFSELDQGQFSEMELGQFSEMEHGQFFEMGQGQFSKTHQPKKLLSEPQHSQEQFPEIHSEPQQIQHSKIQQLVKNNFLAPVVPSRSPLATQSICNVPPTTQGNSMFFRGVCFFYNALNRCRYDPCRFSHNVPKLDEMRQRLRIIQDKTLLRELALVRSYPLLAQRYSALFVMELAQRGLTRAMMETLPAVVKSTSPESTAALEAALMHLNSVEPNEVQSTLNPALCDAMLITLANTQNFSRFRAAFTKFAQFVAEKKRRVPLDVASKILERVCILPSEENLAKAMLRLIIQTDPSIYESEMMASFEAQLDVIGGGMNEEFLLNKAHVKPRAESPLRVEPPEQQERYTSPDTTHYDPMNHLPISPMITRTVDLKRARTDTVMTTYNLPIPPPNQITNYKDWRKTYPHLQRPNGPRPPGRPYESRPPGRPHELGSTGRPNIVIRNFNPMKPNMPTNMGNKRTVTRRPVTIPYGAPNNYQHMAGDYND